jgi:hypothetical protein
MTQATLLLQLLRHRDLVALAVTTCNAAKEDGRRPTRASFLAALHVRATELSRLLTKRPTSASEARIRSD